MRGSASAAAASEVDVPLNGDHVETARSEIEKLLVEKKGGVTPDDVVEAASDPKTKLHGLFEWEDSTAAARFRVYQARAILRQLGTPSYRARFYKRELLNVETKSGRRYVARSVVLHDKGLREQEVTRAWKYLRRFVDEWGDAEEYPELERIAKAIKRAVPKTIE